jgi:hypothetical protein
MLEARKTLRDADTRVAWRHSLRYQHSDTCAILIGLSRLDNAQNNQDRDPIQPRHRDLDLNQAQRIHFREDRS